MKRMFMKLLVVGSLLVASCWRAEASGTWIPLASQAPEFVARLLLLTDGTVMVNSVGSNFQATNNWYRLTPDIHGSYVNGTWSSLPAMNYARLHYASQVLPNGDVFVAGGEDGDPAAVTSAEVWNSQANTWSLVPNTNDPFADANSKLLPDGKVLVGLGGAWTYNTVIYDPVSNTTAPGPVLLGYQDETDWVQLPDQSFLTVDSTYLNVPMTEVDRYIPSSNQWIHDTPTPVDLFDHFYDSSLGFTVSEIGSFHLLPNGNVFAIGGASLTAIYTPSGSTNPGTWVQGPPILNNQGAIDAPAASMVNGKILMALGPTGSYSGPISFNEYDYGTNTLTPINGPTGLTYTDLQNDGPFVSRMLALPDGSILFSVSTTGQCYVYQPDGTPLAAGKPSIQALTTNSDGSYHLTGTGFNGISEGAKYGDDDQMDTNWPIVRVTNNVSGNVHVYYAKTFGWNPGVVATGTTLVATDFSFPAGLPAGTYSLVVVANGNSSDPFAFSSSGIPVASPTFSPPAGTYTSAQTVTITSATSSASIAYTTDGTTPTESGGTVTHGTLLSNGGSVSIGTTTTLQAIGYETGYPDSGVASGLYTISSVTVSPGNGFDNLPMSSSQSGTFTATFDASPSISPINAVMALSKGAQTAYTGLSCIARFNTSGDIDAYNGTAYQAASVIPYAKALTYHFRMVVNVPANTYSVYVTPPGGSELTVGLNYKFRKAASSLDMWTIDVNATPGGSVTVGNRSVSGSGGIVAPPSFSPVAGTYSTVQTVLINDSTIGSSIRYTTDGSTPSETAGTPYTGSISIGTTTKLEAIAYKTGMTDSTITIGTYTITLPPSAPVFSPGAGTYTSAPTVTITSSGATAIYYTTNGSTPTSSSTQYIGPIPISTNLTLEAIGINSSGTSPVTTGQYTINPPPQVAPPVFSPGAGTYTSAHSVTITSATSGASIAYTTDGSTPTESGGTVTHGTLLPNGGAVTISVTTTLNALAFKTGMTDSPVTTGNYTIILPPSAPVFSPSAGTYTSVQTVTITSAGATAIYYTTNGSTPTSSSTHYTGPIPISTSLTLKAIGTNSSGTSPVTTGVYTINVATRSLTGSSGDGFHALALTSAQTGTFTATFDATPTVSPENAVVGLSKGVATAYTGLSCIARFNTSGDIDAYNGTAYQAAATISYTKNTAYHFRMVVNVPAHTYSVYVTPAGGSELTVGLNYAFRVTQTSLDTWNLDVNSSPSGCSLTANNLNP